MKLRLVQESIPLRIETAFCPDCGRRRIPYLPKCLCGKTFEHLVGIEVPEHKRVLELSPEQLTPPAEDVFRIAHWSDLHLGSRTPDGQRVEVRLRTMLNLLRELRVDALIISGDLTRFGMVPELTRARELLEDFDFGGHRLVVVPGNHDIPRGQGSENFCQVFECRFPMVRELGPGVWIAALDSNLLDERMLFERRWVPVRGRVGSDQIAQLKAAWSSPPEGTRLLILHHHLARLSPESRWSVVDERTFKADQRLMAPLLDCEEVLNVAHELGFTACLHGHKHWYSRTGYRVGALPVFNAGSVTRMVRPQFRLFDYRDGRWDALYRVEVSL